MRTKGFSSSYQHRRLFGAETSSSGPLLRSDFGVGAVNLVAGFRAGCSLSGCIAFEDDGAVEDVAAEGEIEVFAGVGFET